MKSIRVCVGPLLISCLLLGSWAAPGPGQEMEYRSLTHEALRETAMGDRLDVRVLVDAANLGGEETRIAELTFAAGYRSPPHTHEVIEIFYVLSGRFGHEVNGEAGVLEEGQVGICRPGDTIVHSAEGDEPAVVLTIWLPGGATAPFGPRDRSAEGDGG